MRDDPNNNRQPRPISLFQDKVHVLARSLCIIFWVDGDGGGGGLRKKGLGRPQMRPNSL